MSIVFQTICFISLFGIISSWPVIFQRPIFPEDDLNRMMQNIHQRFERIFFNRPQIRLLKFHQDESEEEQVNLEENNIEKRFETMEPICTTIYDSPTTISPRKSRRRKPAGTQTTTCIKEFVLDGRKYYSEDVKTVNEKGLVIKQSTNSGSILIETDERSKIKTVV